MSQTAEILQEIELDVGVDTHTHPRNLRKDGDGRMEIIVPELADEFEAIVAIGNSKRPVVDIPSARAWRADIQSCTPAGNDLQVLVAALMRDDTSPEMVRQAWDVPEDAKPEIDVMKIFFQGVSNDYGNSVSDVKKVDDVIRATYSGLKNRKCPMPITIHAERKYDQYGKRIEMRDREWYAIRHDVDPLVRAHPDAQITVAHVTDARTVDWVYDMATKGYKIYGEIGAHYLFRCHEDLYEGKGNKGTAFRAHDVCWPIYKNERSMSVLRVAALSGATCFHYGSDWACHADDPTKAAGVKITSDGEVCGGVAIWPSVGKSLIIDLFMEEGDVGALNRFLSENARAKLGLPPAKRKVRYRREDWQVPAVVNGEGSSGPVRILPFMRGETCHWKKVI